MSLIAEAKRRHAGRCRRPDRDRRATRGTVGHRALSVSGPRPPRPLPSLRLYLADDYYCCLGCGSKGDVVQWVRDTEQVSVAVAIAKLDAGGSKLDQRLGWPGPRRLAEPPFCSHTGFEPPQLDRTTREAVFAALDAVWASTRRRRSTIKVTAYLASRGIDVPVLETRTRRTEIGHTPNPPMAGHRPSGCKDSTMMMVDAGLARRRPEPVVFSTSTASGCLFPFATKRAQSAGSSAAT